MSLNIGTAVAYLEMDTSGFTGGMKSAWQDLKDFTDSTLGAEDRLRGLSNAAGTVGSGMTKGLTVPLLGAAAAAVKTGMDFDAQMSKVKAISGATSDEFVILRDKAIQMGNDTKFSAYESAQAFEYMAMAGWKTEDMLGGIEGIMSLAAASGEDLALTSDIVTDALTAFGMSADEAGRFADILAAASSNSNTNVAMMGETFKYVAPLFGAMGYTAEDAALAIGLMANSGIKASQSGTALRGIIQRMAKPTKESGFAMEMLGISITDAEGNMKPFREVLENIRSSMGNVKMASTEYYEAVAALDRQLEAGEITQKDYEKQIEAITEREYGAEEALKAKYAAMLAGTAGLSGYLALVNATDEDLEKLTNAIDTSSDVFGGQGEAARQSQEMLDNFKGSLTLLSSALTTMAIVVSDRVTPYIEKLTEWIQSLVDKFNSLSPQQQDQIVKWGLIVAAIGPVLLIVSKLIGAIATIVGAISGIGGLITSLGAAGTAFGGLGTIIGAIANPIGIAVVAIGALVAAVIYFWNTSEGFRNFFIGCWEGIKNFFSGTIDIMKGKMDQHTENTKHSNDEIIESTEKMQRETSETMKRHEGNTDEWSQHVTSKAKETGEGFKRNVVESISKVPNDVSRHENETLTKTQRWSSDMKNEGEKAGKGVHDGVVTKISEVPRKVSESMNESVKNVSSVEGRMKNSGMSIIGSLLSGIILRSGEVNRYVSNFASGILDMISSIIDGFNRLIRKADAAKSASRSVNGRHANGLDYVPFNGYVAELHEGERVLTKQENKEYNSGLSGFSGDTFVFYNTEPDPYEYARQMKRAKKEILGGF